MQQATISKLQDAINADADRDLTSLILNLKAAAQTLTPTYPPLPGPVVKSVRVGSGEAIKSIDDINLNKDDFVDYICVSDQLLKRKQRIDVPGVNIIGISPAIQIDADGAKWLEELFVFTDRADGCGMHNLTVCGHDGGCVAKLEGAKKFRMIGVRQIEHPAHKGGVTPLIVDGCESLEVKAVVTTRTARYSVYLGNGSKRGNKDVQILDCNFGQCAVVESEKSSGLDRVKKKNVLHGGGWSEHPFRCYGVVNLIISGSEFHNDKNTDGKQAAKFMDGDGATVSNCAFFGSVRNGRDINDPEENTMKVTFNDCHFQGDWFRVDDGGDVIVNASTIKTTKGDGGHAIVIPIDAKTKKRGKMKIIGTRVSIDKPGGRLVDFPAALDYKNAGNSWNGQTV